MWPTATLSPVFKLPFRYISTNPTPPHLSPKGGRVVAFVGIELGYFSLRSDPELLDRCLGTDTVVSVAFDGHVGQREPILLREQRDVRTNAVVLATVAGALELWRLYERTVEITKRQIEYALLVEDAENLLPDQLQRSALSPEVESTPTRTVAMDTCRARDVLPATTSLEDEQYAVKQLVIRNDMSGRTDWLRQLRCQPVVLCLRQKECSIFHAEYPLCLSNLRVLRFLD